MPEYMRSRRSDESESFFCRFTFGQFFALLVLEVFTLFFVFYLGARYGRGLLGLDKAPAVAVQNDVGESARVITTADPAMRDMARDLISKADTPELKDRIRKMINEAQEETPDRMPEVITVGREPTPDKPVEMPVDSVPEVPPAPPAENATLPVENANPARDAGVVRIKSAENAKYSVQVGSYPNMAEATSSVERWKNKGYPAYLMIADIPDRGRWFRVRIGGFETRGEASRYMDEFATKETVEALVVLNEQ
jgi:cell division septation protein DedD